MRTKKMTRLDGHSIVRFRVKKTVAATTIGLLICLSLIVLATFNEQFRVNAQATTPYITVTPSTATIAAGDSVNFTTTFYDQDGNPSNVTATYTVNDATITGSTVAPTIAGSYLIQAEYEGMTATASLTVTSGALHRFVVLTPTSAIVDQPFEIMIVALDAYRNEVTSFTGTVSIGVTQGSVTPTQSGAFDFGEWLGAVTLSGSGSVNITVNDNSGHTGQSPAFTVNSAAPTSTPSPSQTPNTSATPTVQPTATSSSTPLPQQPFNLWIIVVVVAVFAVLALAIVIGLRKNRQVTH